MKSYCSFLIINPRHAELVDALSTPDVWSLRLVPDPSERFWFTEHGWSSVEHPQALRERQARPNEVSGQLVVVESDAAYHAENMIRLACAAYDVIEGNPSDRLGPRPALEILEDSDKQDSVFQSDGFFEKFAHRSEIPVALSIAATAWLDQPLVYAIHKLSQSFATDSITWWSTHPRHGQIFEKSSKVHAGHVNTSVAINLAFSAIEELQLQVKSSAQNTRWLDTYTGEWNPTVLEDIQRRLRQAGVDPSQKVAWIVRGEESVSEAAIKPRLGSPAPYADGQTIRDVELTLPEALHICSYLRNFMTAHRFSEVSTSLGPYEVYNVQSVARRLIISKCGVWNIWADGLLRQLKEQK